SISTCPRSASRCPSPSSSSSGMDSPPGAGRPRSRRSPRTTPSSSRPRDPDEPGAAEGGGQPPRTASAGGVPRPPEWPTGRGGCYHAGTMAVHELLTQTLSELTATLRARRASPVELMQATLARIDEANPNLNAVCSRRAADDCLADARAAEARIAHGETRSLNAVSPAVRDVSGDSD